MSDLISRSALIKVLKDRATNEAIMGYMTAYDVTNSIIDEVEEQPTAYDVDKVVEELEISVNEANNNCLCEMHENGHTLDFENENGRIKGLKEAIEIVKQGVE